MYIHLDLILKFTCRCRSYRNLAGVIPAAGAEHLIPLTAGVNLDTVLFLPGVGVAGRLVVLPGREGRCPGDVGRTKLPGTLGEAGVVREGVGVLSISVKQILWFENTFNVFNLHIIKSYPEV